MAGIDLAVLVADVFDLEGSFATGWVELIKAPVLVALNKIDLLPAKTPVDEVATIAEKIWAKRLPDLGLRGVIPVSAKKSRGLTRLREEIVLNRETSSHRFFRRDECGEIVPADPVFRGRCGPAYSIQCSGNHARGHPLV